MANTSNPTLANLPTELIEHISTFLSINDVCSLNLVCRTLVQRLRRFYAKTVFSRLPIFINSDESLDSALSVVNDAEFGTAVRKLSLYIEEFNDSPSSLNGEKTSRETIDQESFLQEPGNGRDGSSGDSSKEVVLLEKAEELESATQTRLTTLLRRLRDLGNLQEIQLSDLSSPEPCPIIPKGVAKPHLVESDSKNTKCLERVFTAIHDAHLPVPKLSLMPERWAIPMHSARKPPLSHLFKAAFQNIQDLHLHCWLSSDDQESPRTSASEFMALVASAPKLTSLTIRHASNWDYPMQRTFDKLQGSQRTDFMHGILEQDYPRLKALRLIRCGCGTSVHVLQRFVQRHVPVLERLALEDVGWYYTRIRRLEEETEEEFAKRYFKLPGVYKVHDIGSLQIRLDFEGLDWAQGDAGTS